MGDSREPLGVRAVQVHELAARLAADITPDIDGRAAVEVLAELNAAAGHHDNCDPATGFGRPTIIATITFDDLKQYALGTADIEGGVLSAGVLRRWACDANLIPKILGSDGECLDFGRRTRLISPGLRRYLISREGGCLYPDYDAPPERCEAHHWPPWAEGGEIKPEHLTLQCLAHHHMIHDDGWTLSGDPEIDDDLKYQPPTAMPHPSPPNAKPATPSSAASKTDEEHHPTEWLPLWQGCS